MPGQRRAGLWDWNLPNGSGIYPREGPEMQGFSSAHGPDRLAACLGVAASEKRSLEHPYQDVSLLLPIHLHTLTSPCVMLI